MAMLTRGSPRAAYFYEMPDTSTFRYRVYNVCQTLAAEPRLGASASWFHTGDLNKIDQVLDRCDVLVICRTRYTDKIARMVSLARARRRRILFDVDDLIFDLASAHIVMDTLGVDFEESEAWDTWFALVGRIGATMRLCDGAIVSNAYLASRAEAFLGAPARIIPNYLNREQMELSETIWREKERCGWQRDDCVHLGYFSGTPTHNRDFALIAAPLARLMDEDERVRLRIVGFLSDFGPDLARHRDRIETLPLQDFLNLQREIGAVEVNLVPLQDNVFTNCKSELKWFEAAIVGTATVAAPTRPYRDAIAPGLNGWLAPVYAWEDILRTVIHEGEDTWREVASRARADAESRHGWQRQGEAIRAALFGL
jgi:glycosyltransferase involved in cell wall biosynthesis